MPTQADVSLQAKHQRIAEILRHIDSHPVKLYQMQDKEYKEYREALIRNHQARWLRPRRTAAEEVDIALAHVAQRDTLPEVALPDWEITARRRRLRDTHTQEAQAAEDRESDGSSQAESDADIPTED